MLALLCTGRDAHGMVLHDIGVEEQVEPVGVPVLLFPKPSVSACIRVLYNACCHQLGQMAVDSALAGIDNVSRIEVAFLLQILINGHLLLGIHDVEVVVVGLKPCRELSCIVDIGLASLTFLGIDNNYSCHGTGTIDGCG